MNFFNNIASRLQVKTEILKQTHRYKSFGKYEKMYGPFKHTGITVHELVEPGIGVDAEFLDMPTKKEVKEVVSQLGPEFKKWRKELKDNYELSEIKEFRPNEIERVWSFKSEDDIKEWGILTDSEADCGFSTASFKMSPNGHAMFSGNVSTVLPKDGEVYRTGFCGIRSPRKLKSFFRKSYYDWNLYTHVVMRVRGDGRTYMVNLGNEGEFDLSWYNMYSYGLYTRGGPYWQTAKIPFSKFVFCHKGHIQDKQEPIQQDEISSFGLTIADSVSGPFQLEIDYIGLVVDDTHTEEFAYELYQVPNNLGDC